MSKKKEALKKKDLNQVAGGGLGASKPIKLPTRGKLLKDNPVYQDPNFLAAFQKFNEKQKGKANMAEFASRYYQKS